MSAALQLRGVSAGYGGSTVLHNVDLTVPAGSVVALLGPNGAGKSTLLRVAAGLLPVRSGRVDMAGIDVSRLSPARRARAGGCLIPEGRGVFPQMTVRENLALQVPPGTRSKAIGSALDVFPVLHQYMKRRAGAMSGGEQQMLALARAWLANPSVVLLDEVSMGLAPRVVDDIFLALRTLAATGTALLLVEQYVDRALELADYVTLLQRGTVAFDGPAAELDRDAVLHGYLGVEVAGSA